MKSNTDEYKCADYELSLDNNMAFVHFKEINIPFIRGIMYKIADALCQDKDCWCLYDEYCGCEIDINAESYEPDHDDDNESLCGTDSTADITDEEDANEIFEEYRMEEEEKISEDALNAKKVVHLPKEYNGHTRETYQYLHSISEFIKSFNNAGGVNKKQN